MTSKNKALILATTTAILAGVATIVSTVVSDCETTPEPKLDGGVAVVIDASVPGAPDAAPVDPIPPTGRTVTVVLKPTTVGTHWVSFGLPMPPGSVASQDDLRVTRGGVEVPTFRKSLGNWMTIPPAALLCGGVNPTYPGVRSVLIQFQHTFATTADVLLTVELGKIGQKLAAGVDVKSTYRVVNDGRLYMGTENVMEPKVFAAIDHKWLSCAGLTTMIGPGGVDTELAKTDVAQKNFFYTSIKDYRSSWDAAPGSWAVAPTYAHVDLVTAENGAWLYQRAQTFYNVYMRTGMFDALREAQHAASHYRNLIYNDVDCAALTDKKWCLGFFKPKNPDPATPYKDVKYSYSEDLATQYWLSGDATLLPYLTWMSAATKLALPNQGWTERNQTYALAAPIYEYEVTGNATALAAAKVYVDALLARQNKPGSDGKVTGCFAGNSEFGADGFSPWMTPLMTNALLRYYYVTGDSRVPGMLAASAQCLANRGMAWTTAIQSTNMLVPFYGGTVVGVPSDTGGNDPWAGIEHAADVAQGVALGMMFTTDPVQKEALRLVTVNLLRSSEWAYANWTRLTALQPKYRLAPWRKYNWWFKNTGIVQWALSGKTHI